MQSNIPKYAVKNAFAPRLGAYPYVVAAIGHRSLTSKQVLYDGLNVPDIVEDRQNQCISDQLLIVEERCVYVTCKAGMA